MAEKEAWPRDGELAHANGPQQSKPATLLHVPAGSLGKHQEADSAAGYYPSAVQKGKLILPTALWILLIIAGVSFLTLLATLNKTVDTLDTLVEIEQEMAALASAGEHIHHHAHAQTDEAAKRDSRQQHRDKVQREPAGADLDFGDTNDGWLDMAPVKASWFALPGWASLESARGQRRDDGAGPAQVPAQIESIMDDMVRRMAQPPMGAADEASAPEITGSIIIASSEPGSFDSLQRPDEPSPFDSILRQVMPMFAGLGAANRGPMEPTLTRLQPEQAARPDGSSGPIISAKIDNLNINFEAPKRASDDGDESKKLADSRQASHEDDIGSLEKSIDNLVSKLVEQKSMPLAGPGPDVAEIMPIIEPLDLVRVGPAHEHRRNRHKHRRPQPHKVPLSPMGGMLMPFDAAFSDTGTVSFGAPSDSLVSMQSFDDSGSPIVDTFIRPGGPIRHIHNHDHRRPHAVHHDDSPVLITMSPDERQLFEGPSTIRPKIIVSGEINRHGVSNTQRPSFGQSPYELSPPFINTFDNLRLDGPRRQLSTATANEVRAKDDAKWEMLSNDLADSILQSVLRSPSPSSSVVMLTDDKPSATGEQQKVISSLLGLGAKDDADKNMAMPIELDSSHKVKGAQLGDQIGDIFSLLLDPSSESKLAQPQQTQGQQEQAADGASGVERLAGEKKNDEQTVLKTAAPMIISDITSEQATDPKQAAGALGPIVVSTAASPAAENNSQPTGDEARDMINDFMNMLASPQFGGADPPRDLQQAAPNADKSVSSSSSSSGDGSSVNAGDHIVLNPIDLELDRGFDQGMGNAEIIVE